MIHVIATISIAPGMRAEYLEHFHWVMPHVHAEEGCIEYGPATDVASGSAVQIPLRPDVVVVIEKWSSLAALHAHSASAHMAEYRVRVKDLVTGVSLQVLEPA